MGDGKTITYKKNVLSGVLRQRNSKVKGGFTRRPEPILDTTVMAIYRRIKDAPGITKTDVGVTTAAIVTGLMALQEKTDYKIPVSWFNQVISPGFAATWFWSTLFGVSFVWLLYHFSCWS